VSGFTFGMLVVGAENTISDVTATGNVVRGDETIGNATWGILSSSSGAEFPTDNVIQGNIALGSGSADLVDLAPVCGNIWSRNDRFQLVDYEPEADLLSSAAAKCAN
jgi:hypothetical protein